MTWQCESCKKILVDLIETGRHHGFTGHQEYREEGSGQRIKYTEESAPL